MINIRKADIDDVITISKLGRITFSDAFESFSTTRTNCWITWKTFFRKKGFMTVY